MSAIGQAATAATLDVSQIPDPVKDELAAATLEFIKGVLRQPGGREMLHKRIAEKQKRP